MIVPQSTGNSPPPAGGGAAFSKACAISCCVRGSSTGIASKVGAQRNAASSGMGQLGAPAKLLLSRAQTARRGRRLGSDRASEAEREKERPHTHRTRLVPKSATVLFGLCFAFKSSPQVVLVTPRAERKAEIQLQKEGRQLGKTLKQRACGKGERVTKQEGCFGPNMYGVPYHVNNLFPGLKLLRLFFFEEKSTA